jgi:hypothetical protein
MINRDERQARIKMQIAKAVSEIDHGDPAAAVLALADGLNAMLHYVESGEVALAARLEASQIKLAELTMEIDRERQAKQYVPDSMRTVCENHPMGEEAKEAAPARIKVTKR